MKSAMRQNLIFELLKDKPGLRATEIHDHMKTCHGVSYDASASAFNSLKRKCRLAKKGKSWSTTYFAIID